MKRWRIVRQTKSRDSALKSADDMVRDLREQLADERTQHRREIEEKDSTISLLQQNLEFMTASNARNTAIIERDLARIERGLEIAQVSPVLPREVKS